METCEDPTISDQAEYYYLKQVMEEDTETDHKLVVTEQFKRKRKEKSATTFSKARVINHMEEEYYSSTGIYRSWPVCHGEGCHNPLCNTFSIHGETRGGDPGYDTGIKCLTSPTLRKDVTKRRQEYKLIGITKAARVFRDNYDSTDTDMRLKTAHNKLLSDRQPILASLGHSGSSMIEPLVN